MTEGNNYKIDDVEFHLRLKKTYIWSKNVFKTCIKILTKIFLGKRFLFLAYTFFLKNRIKTIPEVVYKCQIVYIWTYSKVVPITYETKSWKT